MPIQILWNHYKSGYKTAGYLKLESKEAKLLKKQKDFLHLNGWVRITQSLPPFLSRIEVIDDTDNERSIQCYLDRYVFLGEGITIDTIEGLQYTQDPW